MIRSKEKYLFIYIYLGKVYIYNNFINNIRQKKIGNIRYRKKKRIKKKKKKKKEILGIKKKKNKKKKKTKIHICFNNIVSIHS